MLKQSDKSQDIKKVKRVKVKKEKKKKTTTLRADVWATQLIGGFWPFALSGKNIWHNAPISKLYRGVPLFEYSITQKASYLNNSTMKKPSCGQVPTTLLGQPGFSTIKYSCDTICNSGTQKTST